MVVGDAEVVHPRDVRVLDRRRNLVFAQEAVEVAHARALVRRLVQHLEGDLGAGALAFGEVDAGHRALGELADVAKAADRSALDRDVAAVEVQRSAVLALVRHEVRLAVELQVLDHGDLIAHGIAT